MSARHTSTICRRPLSVAPHRLLRTGRGVVALLFALVALHAGAQQRKVQYKPFIDERRFHYGFTVGFHDQGFDIVGNGYTDPATGDQWLAAADRQNFGLNVGVLGEWKLSNYFALRLIPSLYFGSKHIAFRNLTTGKTDSQDMKSSYIALPVNIKASGPRFNNYRPYVVAGINPLYDLTAGKHTKLRAKPFNVMLEAGLGCDLYLPFFKLIPELKFCFGLGNVLQKKRTDLTDPTQLIYTQSVDRASIGMVVLSFYFE